MFYIHTYNILDDKYALENYIQNEGGYADVYESKVFTDIKSLEMRGSIRVTIEVEQPDLLSYELYGTESLWWALLLYNDLISPKEVTVGKILKYFSKSDFDHLFYDYIVKQNRVELNKNTVLYS